MKETNELKQINTLFIDKVTFSQEVEKIVAESEGEVDHIHVLVELAETKSIELDEIGKFLTESLREKLFADASRLGMVKSKYRYGELPL